MTVELPKAAKMNKQSNKKTTSKKTPEESAKSFREGVESIVIAIVLAFLFRAFEAEAFVIPTGSMATTLQGRHKDVYCDKCNYRYRTGDSIDPYGTQVRKTTCPNCFYKEEMKQKGLTRSFKTEHRSHTGDRILVNKFAYEAPFGEPKRWDVIVFKFPGNAKQNYIKRLIGLPEEIIHIRHGDVFLENDNGQLEIVRKPPKKIKHMLQVVHDSRFFPEEIVEKWPANWTVANSSSGVWKSVENGALFSSIATDSTEWIRFQRYDCNSDIWSEFERDRAVAPRPMLVTDYYTYNTKTMTENDFGWHWVGDLAVESEVEVKSDSGVLSLVLIEANREHLCEIDVATGKATLKIDQGAIVFDRATEGERPTELSCQTKMKGSGKYDIRFSNLDDQLVLWIDNQVCDFGHPATYSESTTPDTELPSYKDLTPVRIGVNNLVAEVKNMRILRDIYYIAPVGMNGPTSDYRRLSEHMAYAAFLNPSSHRQFFLNREGKRFPLEKDQFFPLGDNSPMSKDARIWGGEGEHYVERDMLIGKAVLVYWPHPVHMRIPFTKTTIPVFPNFRSMKLIH